MMTAELQKLVGELHTRLEKRYPQCLPDFDRLASVLDSQARVCEAGERLYETWGDGGGGDIIDAERRFSEEIIAYRVARREREGTR